MSRIMFPVEEKLSEIKAALAANRDVVLTAPPGSGKTTCVPPALLDEPWLGGKKIVMLEPRRLAARNCATFIARKLGEAVGGTVGYQVRLERKISAATRLEVVTEGLLTQRLLSDPELADVGLIVFDEFHERSLACDTSFALALEVRRALREDLRLLVMSATLDADEVAERLGKDASPYQRVATIRAEGRMYPVETKYLGDLPMTAAIAKAVRETDGDILCFLPGEGEIKRVKECLNGRANDPREPRLGRDASPYQNIDILPLYGSLPKEEQDRVFDSSGNRKVILATSIAETSVTIPNISCVIDSGLMRIPRFSPSTGMSGLVTVPLSQDRAEQRRGRAGRVRAGVCYRLWDKGLNATRPKKMTPEIYDADLCSLVLTSAAWGAVTREALPWMTPPPAAAWDQASGLLRLLGALDDDGRLTPKGERMAKLPLHPRLANMLLLAGNEASLLAAQIEEGSKSRETDIRMRPVTPRVKALAKKFCDGPRLGRDASPRRALSEGAALALAYPDRIARNRGNGSFRMVSGRGAGLERDDPLAKEKYLVCCELDDRTGDAKIFLACPIDEEEILALFGDKLSERPVCAWDRQAERVKAVVEVSLGEMVIREKPVGGAASSRATGDEDLAEKFTSCLVDGIRQKGVENLPCWTKESLQLRARLKFLHRVLGDEWPDPSDDAILAALPGFLGGMTKWKDLEKLDLFCVFDFLLSESGHDRRELDRLAPTRMEVPSGSRMTIRYEGDEPTVEARLQECFGLMATPKVAGGRVPIVMTLLSPAQRPVQITKDLAGFWKDGYRLVRKDLRGRYPKHYWPEDPFAATATRRVRPAF